MQRRCTEPTVNRALRILLMTVAIALLAPAGVASARIAGMMQNNVDRVVATVRVNAAVQLASLRAEANLDAQKSAARLAINVSHAGRDTAETTYAAFYWWVPVKGSRDAKNIVSQFGLSREDFSAMNPGVSIDHLEVGDRILIYRWTPGQPSDSIGKASRGYLVAGMPMLDGPYWRVRYRNEAWGTQHTVSTIYRGLMHVGETMPGGSRVLIADLSHPNGGSMPPHLSHQSGRDVDITYYSYSRVANDHFWRAARTSDFDVARQWELFRYWMQRDLVQFIFVDFNIQRRLYRHAVAIGEDPEWLRQVFEYPTLDRHGSHIIRDSPGHDDHYHVRFRCLSSEERCLER